ncbi:Serine protease inhibitor 77Ba [Eumeta japonica]|uniref:Serine protease inhibitor 77Ba n=1 Tax=Eumeta variegata TaxID=151549 RepID=A0A4C1ZN00_EUMVA|nr:Serine protease inhibitor 77Ba [Eumeta japonica]
MVVSVKTLPLVVALSVVTACCGSELSDNCRSFSLKLINITELSRDKRNVVLFPFVTWNLLFTVALAAGGETARQVLSTLELSHENESVLIKVNKALNEKVLHSDRTGVQYTSGIYMFSNNEFQINPVFEATINYGLEIENRVLDIGNSTAAAVTANSAIVSSCSKNNVFSEKDFNAMRMVISTVTSFEGLWMLPFNAQDTTIEPFYNESGEIIHQVYMMNQRNKFPFTNIRELEAFVLELPFGSNDKYCMLILLPYRGTTVSEVYQNLVHNLTLEDVFYNLNNDTRNYGLDNIDIKIPQFEITSNSQSNQRLHNMGVRDMFDRKLANFSRATSESIYVSRIARRANIKVTESGTSACASSSAIFIDRVIPLTAVSGTAAQRPIKSDPVYSPAFIANRPFLYYVMEKTTTTIIFGGVLSESIVF